MATLSNSRRTLISDANRFGRNIARHSRLMAIQLRSRRFCSSVCLALRRPYMARSFRLIAMRLPRRRFCSSIRLRLGLRIPHIARRFRLIAMRLRRRSHWSSHRRDGVMGCSFPSKSIMRFGSHGALNTPDAGLCPKDTTDVLVTFYVPLTCLSLKDRPAPIAGQSLRRGAASPSRLARAPRRLYALTNGQRYKLRRMSRHRHSPVAPAVGP